MSIKRFSTGGISSATPKGSKVWDQETVLGTYESIASITVDSSGASSITFSNIPQNYINLQIRGIGRASNSVTDENLLIQFNSDTGSNYSLHNIYGTGSSTGSNATPNFTASYFARSSGASSTSGMHGAVVADILDYRNTSKYTTIRSLTGHDQNGSGYISIMSGSWRNTDAVTTIAIKNETGANIAEYSSFALYGIRG